MKNIFTILLLFTLISCHQLGKTKEDAPSQTNQIETIVQAIKDQTEVLKEHNKLIEEQNRLIGDVAHKMK